MMKQIPSLQALRLMQHLIRSQGPVIRPRRCNPFLPLARHFHASSRWERTEKHILSDIGEGVKEVQIIQWFAEEGAPIEEWSPLCEVQSDKASVEITSKYSGVIKKIYFGQDDVVQTGDTLLEIEVEGETESEQPAEQEVTESEQAAESSIAAKQEVNTPETEPSQPSKHASLATPAVRGLLKEHGLAIEDITGTGKDGRVLKEDVYKHLEGASERATVALGSPTKPEIDAKQTETAQKLTPVQSAMFKSMTGSLSIPHFLFSDSVDITTLSSMRARLNGLRDANTTPKYSYLPFIIKAVSLALNQFPLLNARLDLSTDPKKPQLMLRSVHNIGVAMDTPSGLIVPVIKAVNARSITSIAEELQRLSQLGQAGKLGNSDLTGGTITVSNIGNIGGEVVAPVIVEGQLAIMGIGKIKTVPIFAEDGVTVKPALQANMSWSADHRVVDGATMARMATKVHKYLEEPGTMITDMS